MYHSHAFQHRPIVYMLFNLDYLPNKFEPLLLLLEAGKPPIPTLLSLRVPPVGECTLGGSGGGGD